MYQSHAERKILSNILRRWTNRVKRKQ